MKFQQICRAWGNSFAQVFARVNLNRVRDNLDSAPESNGPSDDRDADAEFCFFFPPTVIGR